MKPIICPECGHDQEKHCDGGCIVRIATGKNPYCPCSVGRYVLLSARIEELEAAMVCGHPQSAVVQADEGTAWCSECEKEAK